MGFGRFGLAGGRAQEMFVSRHDSAGSEHGETEFPYGGRQNEADTHQVVDMADALGDLV